MRGRVAAASVALGLLPLVAAGPAPAATITVNDSTDDFFAPPGGTCSLREAVQAANTDADFGGCARVGSPGADTIVLEGGQTYSRSRGGIDNTNVDGDLDITGKTTIEVVGTGPATIDANDMDRVIEVHEGARLNASHVALTDGYVIGLEEGTGGGGIRNLGRLQLRSSSLFDNEGQRGASGCGCGGGIENRGRMELRRVKLSHNLATYDGGGIFAGGSEQSVARSSIEGNTAFDGGGIYAYGELSIVSSTIALNDARGGPLDDTGGGLYVAVSDSERVSLTNSTVSGNRAEEDAGGIFRFSGALRLNAVTVTANTADYEADGTGHGGGIDGGVFGTSSDNFTFRNSIVAGNMDLNATDPKPDCSRIATGFDAHDLLEPDGGCPAGPSDVVAADPGLKPLDDNGGPTFTHALKRGSAAIGQAGARAPRKDQRGVRRDSEPDIGAFER